MDEGGRLTDGFEEHRGHLQAVAYRMLGSLAEADDALQEAWLRADRAGTAGVENLGGWLTTIVTRVCLNTLRARAHRREEPLDAPGPERATAPGDARRHDPEHEAVLADEVGVALLVVLDRLTPAERVAFVLHDLFAVPFDEIAPVLERSPAAVRQLASRARRRVQGDGHAPEADPALGRRVVDAFLAAVRGGDLDALVGLLHPEVVLHADAAAGPTPEPLVVRGADAVARGAVVAAARARFTGPVLVDGTVGLAMAPHGRLRLVLTFTISEGRISGIEIIAEPDRLRALELAAPGS
ncbi:sigma-70 family RNA polymerase sigma factor [Pseudonocardia kunmingensis]|uniref:RNA polymerase sigma-70 factor (ECF subfamily) n=1 Tax=Pseudonocardia kunmingensis TaxID=630975 RepID=A0A543D989_9PSEU|nr:sigma-70 family RNA polymerase sigma factor [Pseudonocardia kunmingensis]TQM05880.1 RNA polymerase sigma-70 factor (ECF subfamily) [Pseudonocardia kunmingensis]